MAKSATENAAPVQWTRLARQAIENWTSNRSRSLKFRSDGGAGDVFRVEVSPDAPTALELTIKHLRAGAVPTI